MQCSCCGRWRVQLVCFEARGLLRVSYRGRLVAYCRTVEEVAQLVDLATLEEITAPAPASRASRAS